MTTFGAILFLALLVSGAYCLRDRAVEEISPPPEPGTKEYADHWERLSCRATFARMEDISR